MNDDISGTIKDVLEREPKDCPKGHVHIFMATGGWTDLEKGVRGEEYDCDCGKRFYLVGTVDTVFYLPKHIACQLPHGYACCDEKWEAWQKKEDSQ